LRINPNTQRRKAIAGILAGLIFFAMLFTVGLGLVLYTLNSYNTYNKAQVAANQNQQAKGAESLDLMSCSSTYPLPSAGSTSGYPCSSADPSVWVENDGGTSVTIVSISISQNASGSISQIEAPSVPPTTQPTPNLPVTIDVGGAQVLNTNELANSGDTYTIEFITQTGNTFSVVYPPVTANANMAKSTPSSSGIGFLSFNFETFYVYPVSTGSGCSTLSYAINSNGVYPAGCVLGAASSAYTVNNPSGWSSSGCDSTTGNSGCYYAFSINASSTNPQGLSFNLDANTYLQPNTICLTDDNCEDVNTPTAFEAGWEIGCVNSNNVILSLSTCSSNGSWIIPAYPAFTTIYWVYQLTQAPPTAIDTVGSWGCSSPGQTTCDSLSTTPIDLFFHGTEGANLYGENMPFATTLWTSANAPTVTVACLPGGAQPSIGVGTATTCTATVTGATGSIDGETMSWGEQSDPGTVSFTPASGICTLAGTPPSCSITVTGVSVGGLSVQALYSGDSNNAASTGSVDVIVETTALSVTASAAPSTVETGGTSVLTATVSGGSTPYSYAWYSDSSCTGTPISGATSSTYDASSSSTGSYPYCVEVTDANGGTAEATVTVTVIAGPSITASANPAAIDNGQTDQPGQTSVLTATASGGSGTYTTYAFYSGASCTGSPLQSGSSATYTTGRQTSTATYCVEVTDSLGGTATTTVVVTVNPALSTVTLGSFTTNPVGTGQSDGVTVSWGGGTANYGVTLYYTTSPTVCSSSGTQAGTASGVTTNSHSFTFSAPSSPGTYYYCATVTDSLGASASSSGTYSLTVAKHVTRVQQVAGTSVTDSGNHQFTCTLSAPTQGDLIMVAFTYYSSSSRTVSSVADSRGSSFSVVGSGVTDSATVATTSYIYAASAGSGAGSDTITVKLSGSYTASYVTCSEWSGVVSVAPVTTASNTNTGTSTLSASVSSFTPVANNLVYAYVGYTSCSSSGVSYNGAPYSSGTANGGDYGTGTQCSSSGSGHNYVMNDADEYVLAWGGGSTTSTFSIAQGHSINSGTAGWEEIVVQFDPPSSGTPTASPSPASEVSVAPGFNASMMSSLGLLVVLPLTSKVREEEYVGPVANLLAPAVESFHHPETRFRLHTSYNQNPSGQRKSPIV
jgi:hypothetical protein